MKSYLHRLTPELWRLIYSYDDTYIPHQLNHSLKHLKNERVYYGHRKCFHEPNPYDRSRFRITYNRHTHRMIMKVDQFLYEQQNVDKVVVIHYNAHSEKIFLPQTFGYPFQNVPRNILDSAEEKERYNEECIKNNMDNRVKPYEFMIQINDDTYIIMEYGQHNGAYITLFFEHLQTQSKYFVTEKYAKSIYHKTMDWIRFFHNPKLVIKTMIHPIKNKKITNAMHIQVV